jgi:CBS domain
MVKFGVKRLPVVDRGRLVGIVSRTDVLRSMHRTDEELQAEIAAVLSDPVRVPETAMVDVTVDEGFVTVCGSVRYPSDLPVLPAIVWRSRWRAAFTADSVLASPTTVMSSSDSSRSPSPQRTIS